MGLGVVVLVGLLDDVGGGSDAAVDAHHQVAVVEHADHRGHADRVQVQRVHRLQFHARRELGPAA